MKSLLLLRGIELCPDCSSDVFSEQILDPVVVLESALERLKSLVVLNKASLSGWLALLKSMSSGIKFPGKVSADFVTSPSGGKCS